MIIERKTTLSNYGSYNSFDGLILLKMATKIPMAKEVAKEAVINHIKGEIEASHIQGNFSDTKFQYYMKDLETMMNMPIIYAKETKHNHDGVDIQYWQLVLDLQIPQGYHSSSYALLPNLAQNIQGNIYGGYCGFRAQPRCPMADFMYSIVNVKLGTRFTPLVSGPINEFTAFVEKEVMIPKNDIVISIEMNTSKTYNRNSIIRVKYLIDNTIEEAFVHRTPDTVSISQYNGHYGYFTFGQLGENRNGGHTFNQRYKGKVSVYEHNGMLVFYDGQKSMECMRPYLDEWARLGIKQLDVLQFCPNRDFFFQEEMNSEFTRINKIVLHFLAKDRLYMSRSNVSFRSGGIGGNLYYLPAKGRKKTSINFTLKGFNTTFFAELVIPVDAKDNQTKALEAVDALIRGKADPNYHTDMTAMFTKYKDSLYDMADKEEDTLARWFSYCTRSSRNTDDGIVRAYVKMKATLEKEYKEIGAYLNCYDFSRCMAVPRVEVDKKLKENCYKSLHIEPKNVIIKSINNKKINPISEMQPTIKFMVQAKALCVSSDFPLMRYYNAKTNVLDLNYSKLKGEVIRDKVKNRR